MGNRGILHNEHKQLMVRPNTNRVPWKMKAWVTCVLEFKGRRRDVMSPRRYTELFFLDEATAFAAGHRPCAECRREDYLRFKQLWQQLYGDAPIDETMHKDRADTKGSQRTDQANIDTLPAGTFIALQGEPYLVWGQKLLLWTPTGYIENHPRLTDVEVEVLTPKCTVAIFAAGYVPMLHPTAAAYLLE
jgi:hypothetical protein